MKKVYIIILNWNRPKDTLDCLKSLDKLINDDHILHVIVVDNGSKDNSVSQFKSFKTDKFNLEIIENNANLGFAAGNNVGLRRAVQAGADFILVLNNDTEVDKYLIENLLKIARECKDVGIFTPKIYFAKGFEFKKRYKENELGRVIWSAGGKIDWNNVYATNDGVDEVDKGGYEKSKETDFATGAAMFVRSEVFKKYGYFDERYFMYLEDVDLCERYKRRGGKIRYSPKSVLWHKVAQSSGIGSDLNDYFITRNRLLFGMTYASLRTKLALIRESIKFLISGRVWQKKGVADYYFSRFGVGSWESK